jgi:hypothetical protein
MWKFLRYITNNEIKSRHEEVFDAIFWIVETLALIFGTWILLAKHSAEWIPFREPISEMGQRGLLAIFEREARSPEEGYWSLPTRESRPRSRKWTQDPRTSPFSHFRDGFRIEYCWAMDNLRHNRP